MEQKFKVGQRVHHFMGNDTEGVVSNVRVTYSYKVKWDSDPGVICEFSTDELFPVESEK